MARADACTLLSLDRYAKIMGINPVHFQGAAGEDIFPIKGGCSDVWWQRSYMGADRVSREDLALAIDSAENDIAAYLGYWPAPKWIARELHPWPRHHRREIWGNGLNVRGDLQSLTLNWGKFIVQGRRYTQLVGHASTGAGTMVWSDPDGDGFDERMTITLPTTLTNNSRQQIKVYHWEHPGECEWEFRDPRSVTVTGGNVVIEYDFWQMIDPGLQDPYPALDPTALNITDAIYIDRAAVYREYTDYSQHSVEFFWEPRACSTCGLGITLCACDASTCTACSEYVQCGCLHPRNNELSIVVPAPGEWNTTDKAWDSVCFDRCEAPDQVKFWYYAGERSDRFLRLLDLDPLGRAFAEAIAWMATARLERNFCNCGALTALAQDLRHDMARTDANGPNWLLAEKLADNPFGTRKGEMMAWRRISKLAKRIPQVAVI